MPLSLYSGHMDTKDRFQKLAFDNLEISRRSVLLGLGALAGAAAAPRLASFAEPTSS
jgi:hypothetical protein